jgi:hypothetical protein
MESRKGRNKLSEGDSVRPAAVRIDAFSGCQLACPLCPITAGASHGVIGRGALKIQDFVAFLDSNPFIRSVELGNSGEAVLNASMASILREAHARGVATTFDQGVNFNHVTDATLEAMVTCGTTVLRVSLDGATPQSYAKYRIGGNFRTVILNIAKLNAIKKAQGSALPALVLQFILFSHNEHEVEAARMLASMLQARLELRLNWSDTRYAATDREQTVRLVGYADRAEYTAATGRHYAGHECLHLWTSPQINWDGTLLGCGHNHWQTMAADVLNGSFLDAVNGEAMRSARAVVRGLKPADQNDPCKRCGVYAALRESGHWIQDEEIARAMAPAVRRQPGTSRQLQSSKARAEIGI